jgi:hypothetical protein
MNHHFQKIASRLALSDSNSFYVTMKPPVAPALMTLSFSNGLFSVLVNGDADPDFVLLMATNLTPPVAWRPLQTNDSATPPFSFSDAGATKFNPRFYHVQLQP